MENQSSGRRAATAQYANACRRSRPNPFDQQEVVFSVRPMCRGDFCFLPSRAVAPRGCGAPPPTGERAVAKRVGAADYTLAYWRRGRRGYNRELVAPAAAARCARSSNAAIDLDSTIITHGGNSLEACVRRTS